VRLGARHLIPALVMLAFAGWCVASTYVVRPSELAVVLRFGAPLPGLLRPGLHFCPAGVERVLRVAATRTFTMPIGFEVQEGKEVPLENALWLTGDTNVLSVRVALQYQVSDPVRYLLQTGDAAGVLRRASETAITEFLARTPVDDVFTTGRAAVLERVRRMAQGHLDSYGAGIQIVSLALRAAEPPSAVMAAFQDVQDARSDREKLINQARGYANETVPRARGEAQTLTAGAAAERNRRVQSAEGDSGRFAAVRAEASRAPDLFRHRVYLETLDRLLPRMRIYVVDPGEGGTRLRLVQSAPGGRASPAPSGGVPMSSAAPTVERARP